MERELKKGDVLECIESDNYITKGNNYTIPKVDNDFVYFIDDKGNMDGYRCEYIYEHFKLKQKGSDRNKESYLKGEHPDYYTGRYKGIKAIDIIHDFELSHCKASALEYILRSGKKDDEIQDLSKAINHLEMYIKHLKEIG